MEKMKSYLGWKIDYTVPAGEPAFAAPDSMSWRVFKNPIALAIGGVAAVLLEFADARIRSGVWDHSVFKTDPIGRSQRTGTAAMTVAALGSMSSSASTKWMWEHTNKNVPSKIYLIHLSIKVSNDFIVTF